MRGKIFLFVDSALILLCFVAESQQFITSAFGRLHPDSLSTLKEHTTLNLTCQLDEKTIRSRKWSTGLSQLSSAVFWQRGTTDLDPELDPRITVETLDRWTSQLTVERLSPADSGTYKCLIRNASHPLGVLVQVIKVEVAADPLKYTDFSCVSENYTNLACSFRRTDLSKRQKDVHEQLSRTNYTVRYRLEGTEIDSESHPVPLTESEDGWIRFVLDMKSVAPRKFMINYLHIFMISGRTENGEMRWEEYVHPERIIQLPPVNLSVQMRDSATVGLSWKMRQSVEGIIRNKEHGFVCEVSYKPHDDPGTEWIVENVSSLSEDIKELNPAVDYDVRVRCKTKSSPNTEAYWSKYSTAKFRTMTSRPLAGPGLIPGAFEEVGIRQGKRLVILYWKGVPMRLRGGPDFHYRVKTGAEGAVRHEDFHDNVPSKVTKANVELKLDPNRTVVVRVQTANKEGMNEEFEETKVYPIHDYSMFRTINLVRFTNTTYEVSWELTQAVDVVDVFWCQTTLDPHLAKCAESMEHMAIHANSTDFREGALNITNLNPFPYRFAIAARGKENHFSGMNWIAKACSPLDDSHPVFDGVSALPLSNVSVEVAWSTPCQARYMPIRGYDILSYPCSRESFSRNKCLDEKDVAEKLAAEKMDYEGRELSLVRNETKMVVTGLKPETRYCFVVRVHVERNGVDENVESEPYCAKTLPIVLVTPIGTIVGGALAGATALVAIIIAIWSFVRRCRKDFKQIHKESCKIILPPVQADKYDDDAEMGYTKIEYDERSQMLLRQMSDHSGSSGLGSTSSDSDDKSARPFDQNSGIQIRHRLDSRTGLPSRHSLTEISTTRPHLNSDAEAISLRGSREVISPGFAHRGSNGSSQPSIAMMNLRSSGADSRRDSNDTSGGSVSRTTSLTDATENTGGYVPAFNFAPSSGMNSGMNTGDNGYVSQPVDSELLEQFAARRSQSSGFSELDSPGYKRPPIGSDYRKPFLGSSSSSGSELDRMEETKEEPDEDVHEECEVKHESGLPLLTKAPEKLKFERDEVSGYVKWP